MLLFLLALAVAILTAATVALAVRNNRLFADNLTLHAQVAYHSRLSGRRASKSSVLQGRLDAALADAARYQREKQQAVVDFMEFSIWVDDNCVARDPADGKFSRLETQITSPAEVTFSRTGHTIEV